MAMSGKAVLNCKCSGTSPYMAVKVLKSLNPVLREPMDLE
jgi:hypothetical protein